MTGPISRLPAITISCTDFPQMNVNLDYAQTHTEYLADTCSQSTAVHISTVCFLLYFIEAETAKQSRDVKLGSCCSFLFLEVKEQCYFALSLLKTSLFE